MRILMLAQFYPPIIGGEERHVRTLASALVERGHDVTVATLATSGQPERTIDNGVKIVRLKATLQRGKESLYSDTERTHAPPFPDPELTLGLKRLVKEQNPEIVHAHNWMLHAFLPLKRWSGARLVVTLHDYSLVCAKKSSMISDDIVCDGPAVSKCFSCAASHYGPLKGAVVTSSNWISAAIERRLVDKFIAVSHAVAHGNRLASAKVAFEVVPNFVPNSFSLTPASDEVADIRLPADPFILFVGDLRRLKGVDVIISAYARLRAPPALVMIGRRCPDTPAELPPGVQIFQSWPHHAIMQAWRRSIFGLAPSVWPEPCATVVMEAMGMGKPMIATSIGGMPELVTDGISGLLVPPGNAEALASAMQVLIDNPVLRERMGTASLKLVQALQAKTVVPRIERIYSDLLLGSSVRETHPMETVELEGSGA